MSPAVVTYFGEVPEPNYGSYVPQYDLASIQVLKGPQGTLFGRNTIGGAILYTPAAPGHEFDGFLSTSVGNENARKIDGAVNIPLVEDKLAVRLAGVIDKRDGYTKDLVSGRDLDDRDYTGIRASVLWTPTENISNTLIYDRTSTSTNGDAPVLVEHFPGAYLPTLFGIDSAFAAAAVTQDSLGPRKTFTTRDTFSKTEKVIVNNRTEIQLGDLTLVNLFGYRDAKLDTLNNNDALPVLTADGTGVYPAGTPVEYLKSAFKQELDQISNEIQLKGQSFDNKLDWQVGAYWLKTEPTGPQGTWVTFGSVAGTAGRNTAYNFTTEESQAVYAHGTYDLSAFTEGLSFELGVRYTEDEVQGCTGTGLNNLVDVELGDCESGNLSRITGGSVNTLNSEEVTWSVGLNWQINSDHFVYAVSRHGYRAGGVNSPSFSGRLAAFQTFTPETVTDYEIGFKSDWEIGDIALRTNVSAFLLEGTDVQAPVSGVTTSSDCNVFESLNPGVPVPPGLSPDGTCTPSDDPAGGTVMLNMGDSEISGVEAEFTIIPLENLTIQMAASYLNTETKAINRPDALAPYMAGVEGIRFEYVAEKTATASVSYLIPIDSPALQSITLRGDYYWTDEISYTGNWLMPTYSVTNLRVDFEEVFSPSLDVGLWVRNAFDKEYLAAGVNTGVVHGLNTGLYGPPRMYGVEVRYNF